MSAALAAPHPVDRKQHRTPKFKPLKGIWEFLARFNRLSPLKTWGSLKTAIVLNGQHHVENFPKCQRVDLGNLSKGVEWFIVPALTPAEILRREFTLVFRRCHHQNYQAAVPHVTEELLLELIKLGKAANLQSHEALAKWDDQVKPARIPTGGRPTTIQGFVTRMEFMQNRHVSAAEIAAVEALVRNKNIFPEQHGICYFQDGDRVVEDINILMRGLGMVRKAWAAKLADQKEKDNGIGGQPTPGVTATNNPQK